MQNLLQHNNVLQYAGYPFIMIEERNYFLWRKIQSLDVVFWNHEYYFEK